MASTRPVTPVSVLVRPELLRTIANWALTAGGDETGGPLLGTVQRSWERTKVRLLVSILATIPPGPRIDAGPASVAVGRGGDGERAASALRWWRSVTGLDLLHLGDWHTHHLCGEPSSNDHVTARRMRSECSAPVWLAAIAVGQQGRSEDARSEGHLARYDRRWNGSSELRFYRASAHAGLAQVLIRVEKDALPCLPPLPWHIADPARFAAEYRLLQAGGFTMAVDAAPAGSDEDRPGLALRIAGDGVRPLTVLTGVRYPHEPPIALDYRGQPMTDGRAWSRDQFLVDFVKGVS